jgi:hypothetical protein
MTTDPSLSTTPSENAPPAEPEKIRTAPKVTAQKRLVDIHSRVRATAARVRGFAPEVDTQMINAQNAIAAAANALLALPDEVKPKRGRAPASALEPNHIYKIKEGRRGYYQKALGMTEEGAADFAIFVEDLDEKTVRMTFANGLNAPVVRKDLDGELIAG